MHKNARLLDIVEGNMILLDYFFNKTVLRDSATIAMTLPTLLHSFGW